MRAIIALAWSGVCLYTYFSGSESPRDHSLRSRQLLVENADTDTTSVDAVDLTLDVDSSNELYPPHLQMKNQFSRNDTNYVIYQSIPKMDYHGLMIMNITPI